MKLKGIYDFVDVPGKLTLDMALEKANRVKWKTKKGVYHYGTVMSVNKEANLVTIYSDRRKVLQEALDMVEKVR
jgi:hypothetical protein